MNYTVEYIDGWWRILKNGEVIESLGKFSDPISPKVIVEEINGQI